MSEPIKPALTPEEWEEEKIEFDADPPFAPDSSAYRNDAGDVTVTNDEEPDDEGYTSRTRRIAIDRPHALAALALYGQPFGFTREDVAMLRKLADADAWRVPGAEIEALADRIEALLPPTP